MGTAWAGHDHGAVLLFPPSRKKHFFKINLHLASFPPGSPAFPDQCRRRSTRAPPSGRLLQSVLRGETPQGCRYSTTD